MSQRRPFSDLTDGLSVERRAAIDAKKLVLRDAMSLTELRKAIGITQEEIAERLNVGQPAVAKLERRRDVKLATLRNLIEAMGGELEIKARFPEGDVTIAQFEGG